MTLPFKRLARPVASRRLMNLHHGHAAGMALYLGGDPAGDASPACPVSPVVPALTRATEYASIEDLLAGELDRSVHVECFRETTERAMRAVGRLYAGCRQTYYLGTDRGFDRDTVRSYLRFFSRLAGGAAAVDATLERFGLTQLARTTVRRLTPDQAALLNFARMSLFEPEVCFCEHPLHDLGSEARAMVLSWIGELTEAGCTFVTCGQPLRQALLLDGEAWWEGEDGRLFRAQVDEGRGGSESTGIEAAGVSEDDGPAFAGDEVRVCKIPAKAGAATLLFDPREIDFIEAMNKANYVSVRGELYPVQLTMDELEAELGHSGFFRCHRSYIVNVQKVAKVERYTRNAFNLTLNDVTHTSIPLAKGRAEEMRERYGWREATPRGIVTRTRRAFRAPLVAPSAPFVAMGAPIGRFVWTREMRRAVMGVSRPRRESRPIPFAA